MSLWTGDRCSIRDSPRILFPFLSICPELEPPLFKIHAIHRRSAHGGLTLVPSSTLDLSAATLTVTFLSDSVLETLPDQIAIASSGEKGRGSQVTDSFMQRSAEGETS